MTQLYTYSTNWLKGKNNSTGDYKFTATIDENSQNQNANTSNITVRLTLVGDSNSGTTMWSAPGSVGNRPYATLSGDVSATGDRIVSYNKSTTPLTLVEWTGNIQHDSDGTKTITVAFDWVAGALQFYPASFTVTTATVTLTPINRGATLEVSDWVVNDTTDKMQYKINCTQTNNYRLRMNVYGSWSTVMASTSIPANVVVKSWINNTTLLDTINASASESVLFALQGYINGSWTTVDTKTVTVSVNTNAIRPSVDINSIMINSTPIAGQIIAGYTTMLVDFTTTASYGSGVTLSTTFSLPGVTFTPSTSSVIGNDTTVTSTLPANAHTETSTLIVTVTDSRGASSIRSDTFTVQGYKAPAIDALAYRCDSGGTRDDTNAYAKCTWTATYTSIPGNFGNETATFDGNAYTYGTVVSLPENNTGTFVITAADNVSSTTKTLKVRAATVPLDLYDDGNQNYGMATCGPIAEAGKIKLGNSGITLIDLMASAFQFYPSEIVCMTLANGTDADDLFPANNNAVAIYYTTNSTGRSNWPNSRARAIMVAARLTSNYGLQLCWGNTDSTISMRVKNTSWQSWKSITFS